MSKEEKLRYFVVKIVQAIVSIKNVVVCVMEMTICSTCSNYKVLPLLLLSVINLSHL